MTSEKPGPRPKTIRIPHAWHEAYASALSESDPEKLIGRIEYAISAIERRYYRWGTDPGSAAELTAIQKCISTLKRLVKKEQVRGHGMVLPTASTERSDVALLGVQVEYLKQHTNLMKTSFR